MKFIKIVMFLAVFIPLMPVLSGCKDDSFLEAMKEEKDFIAPYDVVISDNDTAIATYFNIADTGFSYTQADIDAGVMHPGDDGSITDTPYERSFTVKHNGEIGGYIVEDNRTKLTWTKCTADGVESMKYSEGCTEASVEMSRGDAITTCDTLNYAGFDDWRLPSLAELFTLLYFGGTSSYADLVTFPDTAVDNVAPDNHYPAYWTAKLKLYYMSGSTTSLTEYGWVVYFSGGGFWKLLLTNFVELIKDDSGNITTAKGFVRCVRGGNN